MSATDFEINDPELNDPIELPTEEVPEDLLTEEDRAERQRVIDEANAASKAQKDEETQTLLNKFKGFVGVLEEAPERRAAPEAAAPPPPQPSQAQIDEWNDKLREMSVTNPLQYAAMMRQGAVEEAKRQILTDPGTAGMVDGAAHGFIERFKSDKKGESRFFSQIEKLFDKEVSDLPPGAILQMTPEQRKSEFARRWKAAAGEYFESNAKPTQHLPTSGSVGRSVAPSSGGRRAEKIGELDDGSKMAIMRRFMQSKVYKTPEEAKKAALNEIAKIEYGVA